VTGNTDPNGLLPDGYFYTFDGTVVVDPGPFDAAGVFGLNAFLPIDLPIGIPVMATSDDNFFDSRKNTLRDFLVDLTFAGVTNPGTVTVLGKAAVPGALPANITIHPDVSIFVDIVTGSGLAFTRQWRGVACDGRTQRRHRQAACADERAEAPARALSARTSRTSTTTTSGKVCGRMGQLSSPGRGARDVHDDRDVPCRRPPRPRSPSAWPASPAEG
jgi:hypothetical protein